MLLDYNKPCSLLKKYLLLFHKFRIWNIIDDVLAEDRRAQDGVDLFGVDVFELRVQDKLIAL